MIVSIRNLTLHQFMRPQVHRDHGIGSTFAVFSLSDEQGSEINMTMRSPSDMREIAAQLNKLADELEQMQSQKGVAA